MQDLARATRIAPGSKVDLDAHPPGARLGLRGEKTARERTAKRAQRMADLATMLMAEHKRAVLVVLQGMDASGKDGTVQHVPRRPQPDERARRRLQGTELDGARARLPLAHPPGASAARRDRHLQPLALRGRARRARRGARPKRRLEEALRGHQRDFEQHLATRARPSSSCSCTSRRTSSAKRLPGAHRRSREALEVRRPPISPSARAGTTTGRPTARGVERRRPTRHRGTSCPPTTSGCAMPWSPRC